VAPTPRPGKQASSRGRNALARGVTPFHGLLGDASRGGRALGTCGRGRAQRGVPHVGGMRKELSQHPPYGPRGGRPSVGSRERGRRRKWRRNCARARSNAYGQTKLVASSIIQRAAARSPVPALKPAIVRAAWSLDPRRAACMDDVIWRAVMCAHSIGAYRRKTATACAGRAA